jgi:2-C-methyl-D-erythritol 4-phosphate cytidylyltransferase
MKTKLIAIVPAAGVGARAGRNAPVSKQYQLLKGEPMLRWAVRALLADERIDEVRVAVARDDIWVEDALQGLPRTVWRRCGGPTRAETVEAALQDAAPGPDDWVLVHDAARPGLPADALRRLLDACLGSRQGGLLAQPVADTVKLEHPLGVESPAVAAQSATTVQRTIDRQGLWLAQTPQMFPAGALRAALNAARDANANVTDEASAMELAGHAPRLIAGSPRNFKVTWPEDFELIEKWL